jgi:hypothetical protein
MSKMAITNKEKIETAKNKAIKNAKATAKFTGIYAKNAGQRAAGAVKTAHVAKAMKNAVPLKTAEGKSLAERREKAVPLKSMSSSELAKRQTKRVPLKEYEKPKRVPLEEYKPYTKKKTPINK